MGGHDESQSGRRTPFCSLALVAAPLFGIFVVLFVDLDPANPKVTRMAAVALVMALWWMTEAIPLAATALLPVVLFPLLGIMDEKTVAPLYFKWVIFLFIGGFIVALAMQKWNLHKRIAIRIIYLMGLSPGRILFGFMFASAFLSMWISNTATTMMMIPIVLAIVLRLEESTDPITAHKFTLGLLLGVAYAASIGGMATLIGTPPNPCFIQIYGDLFPQADEITFAAWFIFALPLSIVLFLVAWGLLAFLSIPKRGELLIDREILDQERRDLGPMTFEETVVLLVFVLMALLWLTRSGISIGQVTIPGWAFYLENVFVAGDGAAGDGAPLGKPRFIGDATVAMFMALLLFLIPSKRSASGRIMDWETAIRLPWGIVLLFGGGFALAGGFKESGLSAWIGEAMTGLGGLPPVVIVLAICLAVTFLTEVTSNTATTQMILPILAGLAAAIKVDPLLLMIPATLSASCAFMLPVATPPNAIIFGTGRIRIAEMARLGILLNLIGAVLITVAVYTSGRWVLGIDL